MAETKAPYNPTDHELTGNWAQRVLNEYRKVGMAYLLTSNPVGGLEAGKARLEARIEQLTQEYHAAARREREVMEKGYDAYLVSLERYEGDPLIYEKDAA